jgi:hypothetical protein
MVAAEGQECSRASPLRQEYDERSFENVGDEVRGLFMQSGKQKLDVVQI